MGKKRVAKVAYLYKPDTKYASNLYKAQNTAKNKKIGIWSIKGYAIQHERH
ncbi:thermonuclease family protein [Gottfriedia sp. OAE603]|uniref:thermonuclease family protein n=1 Tax=Gottfriedia sp. OAE603 TaxID=2663872 RepID=UPI00178A7124